MGPLGVDIDKISNANINIAHRDTNSFILNNEKHVVSDNDDELVLSEEQTEKGFSAQYNFENVDSVFFAYKTRNNCYRIDFEFFRPYNISNIPDKKYFEKKYSFKY